MNIYGIIGGTFDPIHNGHIELAETAHKVFNFQKIFLIPNYRPVHGKAPVASPEHRMAMTELAVANHDYISIDDREYQRKNHSYMVDTLESLRRELLGEDTPMGLLVGLDSFLTILDWHQPERIAQLAHIIVVPRNTVNEPVQLKTRQILDSLYGPGKELATKIEMLSHKPAGEVFFIEEKPVDISATMVRQTIEAGELNGRLVPESVKSYITEHNLYQ